MAKMEILTHIDLFPLLKKYIPQLGEYIWQDLNIELPEINSEVFVFGESYDPNTDDTKSMRFYLTRNNKVVDVFRFIDEIFRIMPHLDDIGITRLLITLKPRNLVIMTIEAEMKIDRDYFDKGFLHQYELEQCTE